MDNNSTLDKCAKGARLFQGRDNTCWYMSTLHALFMSNGTRDVIDYIYKKNEKYWKDVVLQNSIFQEIFNIRGVFDSKSTSEVDIKHQASQVKEACLDIHAAIKQSCGLDGNECVKERKAFRNSVHFKRSKIYSKVSEGLKMYVWAKHDFAPPSDINVVKEGAITHQLLDDILFYFGFNQSISDRDVDYLHLIVKNYTSSLQEQFQTDILPKIFEEYNVFHPTLPMLAITIDTPINILPEKIIVGETEFVLDSTIIHSNAKPGQFGHAIAGITCRWDRENDNRYVVNSWNQSTIVKHDWHNEPFYITKPKKVQTNTSSVRVPSQLFLGESTNNTEWSYKSDGIAFYVNRKFLNETLDSTESEPETTTTSEGGNVVQYITYNKRKYRVRLSSKGAKHIISKDEKIYLSKMKKEDLKTLRKA
jgi:hypothetical protein